MPEYTMNIPQSDIDAVNRLLDGWKHLGADLRVPFRRFGAYYEGVVQKTFKMGGRPTGTWPELAEYTLALRRSRNRGKDPKEILSVHGAVGLKGSFSGKYERAGMSYGTNKKYANLHQQGGETVRPKTVIKAKNAKALRFEIGGEVFFRRSVTLPRATFHVPKREMITWQTEDSRMLEKITEDYFVEEGKKHGGKAI